MTPIILRMRNDQNALLLLISSFSFSFRNPISLSLFERMVYLFITMYLLTLAKWRNPKFQCRQTNRINKNFFSNPIPTLLLSNLLHCFHNRIKISFTIFTLYRVSVIPLYHSFLHLQQKKEFPISSFPSSSIHKFAGGERSYWGRRWKEHKP